ncbi:MAG: hypothetical protein WCO51_02365 [bacterium]
MAVEIGRKIRRLLDYQLIEFLLATKSKRTQYLVILLLATTTNRKKRVAGIEPA